MWHLVSLYMSELSWAAMIVIPPDLPRQSELFCILIFFLLVAMSDSWDPLLLLLILADTTFQSVFGSCRITFYLLRKPAYGY
ncbi:hypothetical protein CPB83DRAFT_235255 [Crepidotus variabilis]|uniref:Uncharacterized protein n=1 Tax=Crepidotus variabilis TaxID=179855 RepID=A0A9P6EU08_9AGAR|nr:hypothetical protein CPB83DRAFT_235255 [Crepidotus variabilis]